MIWRVEQRGIGERMIVSADGKMACLGYASFIEQRDTMQQWLDPPNATSRILGRGAASA